MGRVYFLTSTQHPDVHGTGRLTNDTISHPLNHVTLPITSTHASQWIGSSHLLNHVAFTSAHVELDRPLASQLLMAGIPGYGIRSHIYSDRSSPSRLLYHIKGATKEEYMPQRWNVNGEQSEQLLQVRERFSAIVERFEVSSHELREAFVTRNLPPILQIRPQKRAQNTGQAFSSHESRKAFVQFVTPFRGALLGGSWGGGRV